MVSKKVLTFTSSEKHTTTITIKIQLIMATSTASQSLISATQILEQLGGKRFIAMTGSKNFCDMGDGLKMTLTSNKLKAKYLYIQLINDTYTMTFAKIVKWEWVVISESVGIYAEMLQSEFTRQTGMFTKI